jgi:hypothetical protein
MSSGFARFILFSRIFVFCTQRCSANEKPCGADLRLIELSRVSCVVQILLNNVLFYCFGLVLFNLIYSASLEPGFSNSVSSKLPSILGNREWYDLMESVMP